MPGGRDRCAEQVADVGVSPNAISATVTPTTGRSSMEAAPARSGEINRLQAALIASKFGH
jgi:hypothetical protein